MTKVSGAAIAVLDNKASNGNKRVDFMVKLLGWWDRKNEYLISNVFQLAIHGAGYPLPCGYDAVEVGAI
jgi:hypothetical protein